MPGEPPGGTVSLQSRSFGSTLTTTYAKGYRPAAPVISICSVERAVWVPSPINHVCTQIHGKCIRIISTPIVITSIVCGTPTL